MLKRFEEFVTGISVSYKYLQKIKSSEMTKFGLKGTHAMCLFYLHHNPEGLTASRLSKMCAEDKAAISRSLYVLQQNGYIESGEKKYRDIIRLTESGAEVACQMEEIISEWVDSVSEGYTAEEREIFFKVLRIISDNLREGKETSAKNK